MKKNQCRKKLTVNDLKTRSVHNTDCRECFYVLIVTLRCYGRLFSTAGYVFDNSCHSVCLIGQTNRPFRNGNRLTGVQICSRDQGLRVVKKKKGCAVALTSFQIIYDPWVSRTTILYLYRISFNCIKYELLFALVTSIKTMFRKGKLKHE